MAGCKITKSLDNKVCSYNVAGAQAIFRANYYPPVEGSAPVENVIAYEFDTDGYISGIHLPKGEFFYRLDGADNSISFTDTLQVGGNGLKYRQHTTNVVLSQYDIDILNEGDALSLGRFIDVVVDNAGRIIVLGRTSGLSAPAGGFDYNSGTAEADATGWTNINQGRSMEIAPLVKDVSVITPLYMEMITP